MVLHSVSVSQTVPPMEVRPAAAQQRLSDKQQPGDLHSQHQPCNIVAVQPLMLLQRAQS